MAGKFSSHVRNNVVGYLALFVALSGTAWAAATIGADDIVKNAVRSKHVKANGLNGTDVNEATLGQVPSAQNAGAAQTANSAATANRSNSSANADLLDGKDSADFVEDGDSAGGDVGGTFSNLQIGGSAVGAPEVGPNALTGEDIDESSLQLRTIALIEGSNASVVRGRDVTATFKICGSFMCTPIGGYEIVFNRDVSNCFYYATLADNTAGRGYSAPAGEIGVRPLSTNANGVSVTTRDSAGDLADRDFFIAVVC